jgi:hypothetical protein
MIAQGRSGQQELVESPAGFLTALLTDDRSNGAPDRAQMPNCANGATAERRLSVATFALFGLPRPYLVAPLLSPRRSATAPSLLARDRYV